MISKDKIMYVATTYANNVCGINKKAVVNQTDIEMAVEIGVQFAIDECKKIFIEYLNWLSENQKCADSVSKDGKEVLGFSVIEPIVNINQSFEYTFKDFKTNEELFSDFLLQRNKYNRKQLLN